MTLPTRHGTPDTDTSHLPTGPDGPGGRRWRRLDRLVLIAFVALLPLPAVAMLAGARPPEIENRPLYTAPPLTVQGLGDPAWYAALDHAVGDNVAFRELAVRLRATVATGMGGTSNPDVIRGNDDWLFAREELVPVCTFTAEENLAQLDAIQAKFAAAGQEFRVLVAPDKHTIYPEARRADDGFGRGCADKRQTATEAGLTTPARAAWAVPLWQTVAAARAASPNGPSLYWHQDTHWTPTGAVVGIKALILSLDPSLWSDADVVAGTPRKVQMDLARQLGVPATELTPEPDIRPGVTVTKSEIPVPVAVNNARAVFEFTAAGNRPVLPGKTVIVYDSFFGINMERVAAFFADSVWIHAGDLAAHPELATVTGPFDRVILERVQRGLYQLDIAKQLGPLVRSK